MRITNALAFGSTKQIDSKITKWYTGGIGSSGGYIHPVGNIADGFHRTMLQTFVAVFAVRFFDAYVGSHDSSPPAICVSKKSSMLLTREYNEMDGRFSPFFQV